MANESSAEPTQPKAGSIKKPCILVISQVYVPDPTAVGQYMADAAAALVDRGYEVRVLTSARGYDDPTVKYPLQEYRDGVDIRRMPFSSFGKKTIAHRLLGQMLFLAQVFFRGLFTPRLSAVLVSTSPPMASIVAVAIGLLRRKPIKFWAMDINPDQIIAMGKVGPNSIPVKVFNFINRWLLWASSDIVALDRFMGDRLDKKYPINQKLLVMPPWPHGDHLLPVEHDENPFRKEHGLEGKFVIMYSGNHSLTNPIDTVLRAALALQDQDDLVFAFIGGGVRKKEVDDLIAEHKPKNVISLPYQPREEIRYSLSAADVHLVTLGDDMVGIIHPCKIYGAMSLCRPILYFGPVPSHASELVDGYQIGWSLKHGDDETAIKKILEIKNTPSEELKELGQKAVNAVKQNFDTDQMIGEFCDIVMRGIAQP